MVVAGWGMVRGGLVGGGGAGAWDGNGGGGGQARCGDSGIELGRGVNGGQGGGGRQCEAAWWLRWAGALQLWRWTGNVDGGRLGAVVVVLAWSVVVVPRSWGAGLILGWGAIVLMAAARRGGGKGGGGTCQET